MNCFGRDDMSVEITTRDGRGSPLRAPLRDRVIERVIDNAFNAAAPLHYFCGAVGLLIRVYTGLFHRTWDCR